MTPFSVLPMTASFDDSTMAASQSCGSLSSRGSSEDGAKSGSMRILRMERRTGLPACKPLPPAGHPIVRDRTRARPRSTARGGPAKQDLDAAVLRAARGGVVARHRVALAAAVDDHAARVDAQIAQVVAHVDGAVERKPVVQQLAARAVG